MFPDRPKDEVFSKYYTPVLGGSLGPLPWVCPVVPEMVEGILGLPAQE